MSDWMESFLNFNFSAFENPKYLSMIWFRSIRWQKMKPYPSFPFPLIERTKKKKQLGSSNIIINCQPFFLIVLIVPSQQLPPQPILIETLYGCGCGPEHLSIRLKRQGRKKRRSSPFGVASQPASHCFDDVLAEGQVEPSRTESSRVE